jgi:hypothetical protein
MMKVVVLLADSEREPVIAASASFEFSTVEQFTLAARSAMDQVGIKAHSQNWIQ